MRRFKSMFALKRDKSSDLSSSSSSSNGDHLLTPSWKSWIGARRSSQQPVHIVQQDSQSEEEEEDDEEEDEDYQQNIRIHIQNALAIHPLQPNSPFAVHHPHQPIFPRSSNNPNILSPRSSTLKSMFNSHLLARLSSAPLSPSELSSILPFASKSTPSPITHPVLPSSDISRPKPSSNISSASLGIQRWINRPCFEDRFIVYLPVDSGVQCRPVTSTMAIAALEYPEYLDVMVDPDFDSNPDTNVFNSCYHVPSPDTSHTVQIQSHASTPESHPTSVRRNSSIPIPSPLRIQHSPPPPPPPPSTATEKDMPTATTKSTVKRVVRFAEDDEDDGIPLHIVRMKKKREQKAKFLRLELFKRAKEEEEAQKFQEQAALEKERRRLAKDKEKKELDKALYADAIAAARLRREGHRAGTILPSNTINSSNHPVPSPSFTSLRNSERNKPLTDSRKLSSKPSFDSPPTSSIPRRDNLDYSYYHHQSDSSPGSSRSPSIGHSPVSASHPSRPPSTHSAHTSSSEDVRHPRASKRHSVTAAAASSGASSHYRSPIASSYPSWSGSTQNTLHVPALPDFVHDMPLLPPTAPFMKDNRKSRSPGSSSSRRGSINSSNEHVIQLLPPSMTRTSSTLARHHSSSPPSKEQSTQERRASGDSRTMSIHSTQQRPTPTSSWSQPVLSRGRPALPLSPQYLQTPGPWSPLPSPNGIMPMSMPMGYGPTSAYPILLYPTGPMPTMQGVQLGGGGGGGGGGVGGNSNRWREPIIS